VNGIVNSRPERTSVSGPTVWKGSELRGTTHWITRLDSAHISELTHAAADARAKGIQHRDLTNENFPLPTLSRVLSGIRHELRHGCGFSLIKGIDVDTFDPVLLRIALVGLGTHLGVPVSQSFRGDYLGEVMNYHEAGNERPYRSGGEINMHRDPCDIVGLLCQRRAMEGGASRLASAAAVWNAFLTEKPELTETMIEGFRLYRTRDGHSVASLVTSERIPVFARDPDGPLHCTFIAELAEAAAKVSNEALSDDARAAISFFRTAVSRSDMYLDMNIEPGDIQLLNNRSTLHGRTDYRDWPESHRRRLMLRLWLMCPDWPQPPIAISKMLFEANDRANGGAKVQER
jgi:hypothetical protein